VSENDNEAIDYVAGLLTELAIKHRIAVDVPHHMRKGAITAGDADAGRGAGAAKDAFRLVYTLTKMTQETAALFRLSEEERQITVRVDSAKVNIAPPSDTRWYRLLSIDVGYCTDIYPEGDTVGVIEPWTPPDVFEGMTIAIMDLILDDIDREWQAGTPYSDHSAAKKRAAWKVVNKYAPAKNESQCREIIRVWVKNGVVIVDEYKDEERRDTAKGLRTNPEKRPR
jgi:hypothetical protein